MVAGLGLGRRRRAAARARCPTPGVAYLTGSLGADLGVMLSASHNAMPDNGIKFLSRGGVKLDDAIEEAIEAAHCASPGTARSVATSAGSDVHETAIEEYAAHLVSTIARAAPTGVRRPHQGRPGLRPRRRLGGRPARAARGRRRGDRDLRRARRPEHQRRLRLDPPRRAAGAPCSSTAPTSASPSTATPTGAWRSTPRARSSTATRSWRSWRWRCARPAQLPRGHRGRHRDVQPRLRAGDEGGRHRRRQTTVGDRYVLEAMKDLRLHPRRRAVRPRDHEPSTPPPATASSPRCTCSTGWSPPGSSLAELAGVMTPPAAGAGQRPRRRQGPRRRGLRARRGRRRGRGRARRRPAGCCCAPRAPSRWCG